MNIKEMKARLKAIAEECKNKSGAELEALLTEAEEIKAKIADAQGRQRLADMAANLTEGDGRETGSDNETAKRGASLKAKKAAGYNAKAIIEPKAAHTTSEEVLPQHTANGLNGTFAQLSSVLSAVRPVYLPGGESYTRGFVKGYGEGDYTAEGADYSETETQFGKTTITKTKVTAYEEESEEFLKLADSEYDAHVQRGVALAVRKKLARDIMVGDGAEGHLKGIFYNPAKADEQVIDPATDIAAEVIDGTLLDKLVYGYGGEEAVEDIAVLILNKRDLEAFALLRDKNDRKLYNIVRYGNSGTIEGIPYIISSACKAISDPDTAKDDYCMAYGFMSAYELAIFSDMEVKRDESYKFRQGMIANRASAFMGGGVTVYNGFKRVKKAGE